VSELRKVDPAADVVRPKRVGWRRQVSLEAAATPDEGPSREPPAPGPSPEALVVDAELAALLMEIHDIQDISEASRTVLLRGYLAEWDDDELASFLATTRANVHVIRSRDLAKLRGAADFMDRLTALLGRAGS
jgi:DNA-directed RNA polymerase specialized sigma24 family protein